MRTLPRITVARQSTQFVRRSLQVGGGVAPEGDAIAVVVLRADLHQAAAGPEWVPPLIGCASCRVSVNLVSG